MGIVLNSKSYCMISSIDSGKTIKKIPKKFFDKGLVDQDNNLTMQGKIELFACKYNIPILGVSMLSYAYKTHVILFGVHSNDCPVNIDAVKTIGAIRNQNRVKMIISKLIEKNFFIRYGYNQIYLNHSFIESLTDNERNLLSDIG